MPVDLNTETTTSPMKDVSFTSLQPRTCHFLVLTRTRFRIYIRHSPRFLAEPDEEHIRGKSQLPHSEAIPGGDVQALVTILNEMLAQMDAEDEDAEVTAKESELYWKAFQSATSRKTRLDSSRVTVQKWRARGKHLFLPTHDPTQVCAQFSQ